MAIRGCAGRASRRGLSRRDLMAVGLAVFAAFWSGAATALPAMAATGPKVVIIVGPAGPATAANVDLADAAAREALRHTPNVRTIYSPNATWSRVRTAMTGASIVLYIGRGSGFPTPRSSTLIPSVHDGLGLNPVAGGDNSTTRYYGESNVREVKLAPNAAVLLFRMAYASGNSEPGYLQPSLSIARRRVDNYAAGFLAAGAAAVIAEAMSSPSYYLRAILATNASLDLVWRNAPTFHGHVTSFRPVRTMGTIGRTDPLRTGYGYYRSIAGWLSTSTVSVRQSAPPAPTSTPTPSSSVRVEPRSRRC